MSNDDQATPVKMWGDPPDQMIWGDKIEQYGVSQDGKMVRLTLSTAPDGARMHLTMATEGMPALYQAIGELMTKLQERGLAAGGAAAIPNAPGSWLVGRSNDPKMKAFTAIMFDKGTPKERIYMLADVDAIGFADAIEDQIYKALTPPEKSIIDEARRRQRKAPLILPGDANFGRKPH